VRISAGLPEIVAAVLADSHRGIAQGDLHVTSGHLNQLLGRPPHPQTPVYAAGFIAHVMSLRHVDARAART
jgi:NAD(P)H dehydrogenase (quinone)